MDSLVSHNPWITGIFTASALLLLVLGWVKRVVPAYRNRRAESARREAIEQAKNAVLLGTPEIPFNPITGAKAVPATPSIAVQLADIGQRTTNVEQTVLELAQSNRRLDALEAVVASHDHEIRELKLARVEHIVGKAESTAAWHAMEAATNATPDTEAESPED